ncbi:hypothetical protein AMAG_02783 [Allomyces macrogynus ATCC 38327]|uniref:Uncharacterized protein n=1 Tax=Allomyces macrogynus (strain ATCC 38327) TaxID=578462 RepID=A0A0L0S3B5_ALLM3|nr:hypothetical protein AMAG_02783 [Allomyces macrogynus ATCC 38327]|eukprot:KNE57023.1 hypothetical protein AMAG_02783 [Allomyces macrogynus ATCC 38327]
MADTEASPAPAQTTAADDRTASRATSPAGSDAPGLPRRLLSVERFPTIQPVSNRLLAERWDKKRFELHRKALRDAPTTVDDSCPESFGEWRKVNPKKVQIEKDLQATVDHRNQLLLNKFQQVAMRTEQAYATDGTMLTLRDTLSERVHAKRCKQLRQIDHENHTLLARLEYKAPTYKVASWNTQRLQTLHYLVNVSHHKSKYVKEMHHLQTATPNDKADRSANASRTGSPLPDIHGKRAGGIAPSR